MDKDKKPEDSKEEQETPPAKPEANSSNTSSLNKPSEDGSDKSTESSEATKDASKDGDDSDKPAAKPNTLKQTLKRFWLYLVLVMLFATIGVAFAVVSGLQKKKTPPPPSVQSQSMSQQQLKQLKSAGNIANGQTLTIQGDSILDGQELVRGNLNVAGYIQAGGSLTTPNLTISNNGILGNAQASKLQVSKTSAFQGLPTLSGGLDLNGNTAISNATIGTLTSTKLLLSGNGQITVPHHLALSGAFPHRTLSFGVLGNGGSATVSGSDTLGTVSINTGNNPQPGCFITLIFNIPFTGMANILLGPIGLGAGAAQNNAGLHAYVLPITDSTTGATTAFRICTPNNPLPNQSFAFSYLATGSPS